MEDPPKSLRKHLKETLLIFMIGMLTTFLFCSNCYELFPRSWKYFVYSGVLWVVLWKGNEWMANFPNRFVDWRQQPMLRFVIGIIGHIIYTFIASIAVDQLFELLETGRFEHLSWRQLINFNLPSVIVALIISLFLTARSFLYSWRDLAIQHEKLKLESMASRFASLKAQVNPHFLFNSLNVLSGLVYKDADLSAQFIRKLAEVYRYVLDRQEEELVPIQEELEFVRSVVFLQRIRFGEHLHVQFDVPDNASFLVAPMALQMLIENAIKHNIISAASPLRITIRVEGDDLVISNNLQHKKVVKDSLGIGLENIKKRYDFLTDRPVEVLQVDEQFIVKLPIIQSQ
ncbi:MAG: histidine kinase [Saprospiraceae bacterium]|nr:histidine kinase [Lewinella sp.]